jgi:hypothetical protein
MILNIHYFLHFVAFLIKILQEHLVLQQKAYTDYTLKCSNDDKSCTCSAKTSYSKTLKLNIIIFITFKI